MKTFNYLVCPSCRAMLIHEMESMPYHLKCAACNVAYPIINEIPRVFSNTTDISRVTAERFGDEWHLFSTIDDTISHEQFLDWINPLTPEFFKDKKVLDAGCGNGRLTRWASRFGAREVVGIDFGKSVEVAHYNTRETHNTTIIQADIRHLPFNEEFDYAYSIGVLHHLPDPHEGFINLLRAVKTGGAITLWVYGYEGNALVRKYIEPVRRVTSRLPTFILRPFAYMMTIFAYIFVKYVYQLIHYFAPTLYSRLPMHAYIRTWFPYTYRELYSVIYDQLVTPITHYISRDTLETWGRESQVKNFSISSRAGNGWRMHVYK